MANQVIMPKQGLQMTEGTIVRWLAAEGETVTEGLPLFEMETDKLTITIDSPYSGVLLKIIKNENEVVPITKTIAVIGEAGEDISAFLEDAPKAEPEKKEAETAAPQEKIVNIAQLPQDRQFITPRAKKIAEENSVSYSEIQGSGEDGLIIEKDILPFLSIKATPVAKRMTDNFNNISGSGANGKIMKSDIQNVALSDTVIPITGMRKAISVNMMNSVHGMAQANHKIKVDMSECAKIRTAYKAKDQAVSYNDILILILSRALIEFPELNAVTDGEVIYQKHYVNMGVAVAVENGLIVPTLYNSHKMSLPEIHEQSALKAGLAKSGKLTKADYSEGTFTITNLGMFGLDEFTAIINPPQVGILAVGKIADTPVVINGQIAIRPIVTLSLTYDHRIIDGAPAAKFLSRVKELLENPYLCLL